jgi:thymidylate synthase
MRVSNVVARDLPDAWFQMVDEVLSHGRKWTVDHGSYEGQQRWELDWVNLHVLHPGARPLVPEMPQHLSEVPAPTTIEYVEEEYLPYLMTNAPLKENEQYTYGERIAPQMEEIIRRYKTNGFGSNQECIAVAKPSDINLDDPPCLRQIDTRIFKEECIGDAEERPMLHFFLYFRSWDLWGGFPANLAAIRLMQEYMAESIGVSSGEMICTSKGLHLYDHSWDVARLRTGRTDGQGR